jgi:hypothetical protein
MCAFPTAGVDVKRPLPIAAGDVAVGRERKKAQGQVKGWIPAGPQRERLAKTRLLSAPARGVVPSPYISLCAPGVLTIRRRSRTNDATKQKKKSS